jgi:hypothetical protein
MALDTIPKQEGGKLKAVASGTLPSGVPVVVNVDGTVSVISGTDEGFSSTVQISSGNIDSFSRSTFCRVTNKVVVAYSDSSSSYYGTVAVGTISGSSISFGSPVVFESGEVRDFDISEAGSSKVIVAYRNQSSTNDGTARVGTISGSSISFGSASVFFTSAQTISVGYDSNADKTVISYRKDTAPNYMASRVASISGTSVSFGSEANVSTSAAMGEKGFGTTTFDSNLNKIVVSFIDSSWGLYSAVGTVSGTSISYGSLTTVLTGNYQRYPTSAFDTTSNKVILSWHDTSAADAGKVVVGTVSGTSISYGTAVEYSSAAPYTASSSVSYNSDLNQTAIVFSDASNTSVKLGTISGTEISVGDAATSTFDGVGLSSAYDSNSNKVAILGKSASRLRSELYLPATTTLTSENYIGISTGGPVADGGNATVGIVGSVSDEQTGLTAGQQYYVQTDGTLSETPADPSVLAGTAISATKMLVKT